MIQFYFLSILFNALTGYMLITDEEGEGQSPGSGIQLVFGNGNFRLILGILSMATALLKILSSIQGDIPIVGDIIPAFTGFIAGFILIFSYYQKHSVVGTDKYEKIETALHKNKRWIGFFMLVVAALHFLFPQALFL
ncbi:MAG: hypothetical protein LBP42_07615 [Treponema sp.]|jgi:hypothetical protein|nr:hypothetical protein [Treponema sp.]